MLLLRWNLISDLTSSVGMRRWPMRRWLMPQAPSPQLGQHVAPGALAQKSVFSAAWDGGSGWRRTPRPPFPKASRGHPGESPRFPSSPASRSSWPSHFSMHSKSLFYGDALRNSNLHFPAHLPFSPNCRLHCVQTGTPPGPSRSKQLPPPPVPGRMGAREPRQRWGPVLLPAAGMPAGETQDGQLSPPQDSIMLVRDAMRPPR